MNRTKIATVLDEVLVAATAVSTRQAGELAAIKTASTLPRTPLARGLRDLASQLRDTADDLSYGDLS